MSSPTIRRPRDINCSLDLVRGIAAVLVVLGHTRLFVFEVFGIRTSSLSLPEKLLLGPTSLAMEAVAVFFVLSGYLVGGQVIRENVEDRFGWRPYMAKRLSRLWTVLIPGLILTVCADAISRKLPGSDKADLGDGSPITLGCNVIFLQESRCEPYGSNDALWSLAYEFWFYVLFAAVTAAIFGLTRRRWTQVAVGVCVIGITFVAFGPLVLTLLPAWLLGVAVAVMERRLPKNGQNPAWFPPHRWWTFAGALAILAVGLAYATTSFSYGSDSTRIWRLLVVGIASVPLIAVLARHAPANGNRLLRLFSRSSDWSYSSYVYHEPIVKVFIFLAGSVFAHGRGSALPLIYVIAFLGYLVAIGLWFVTERKTDVVRDLFLRMSKVPPRTVERFTDTPR